MTDEEQLAVGIPRELKRLVDADERFNKEVVESALWKEFGGHRATATERRIEYKNAKIQKMEQEIEEIRRQREREVKQRNELKDIMDTNRDRITGVLEDADDIVKPDMMTPGNDAVQRFASEAGITPEQFIKELREYRGEEDA